MSPKWNPILDAIEDPPGTFHVIDPYGHEYGLAELRRVNGGLLRYRASYGGTVIGWAGSARLACERIHAEFLRDHGPQGGPVASWGQPS